jgi:uncharacterized membrane protein YebE (DUF533 family)
VAIAAFEHLTRERPGAAAGEPSPLPPLPVPPAEHPAASSEVVLPPLPSTPESEPGTAIGSSADALLLVRAMIAAANADHRVDDTERQRILQALDESGASDEERRFVVEELQTPLGLAALAEAAASPELARQVYVASWMAIDVDTEAESNYLDRLARCLGLETTVVRDLETLARGDAGRERREQGS